MFVYHHVVQLADTDAYAILFFPNQLRFCQMVFQAWLAEHGMPLPIDRAHAEHLSVVVRCESDYDAPLRVGDELRCEYTVERVGTTSFTNRMRFVKGDGTVAGLVRIVYVCIDPRTSGKIPIPPKLRAALVANPA